MSIKLLVQEHFPGIIVTLSHYPPARQFYCFEAYINCTGIDYSDRDGW